MTPPYHEHPSLPRLHALLLTYTVRVSRAGVAVRRADPPPNDTRCYTRPGISDLVRSPTDRGGHGTNLSAATSHPSEKTGTQRTIRRDLGGHGTVLSAALSPPSGKTGTQRNFRKERHSA